MEIILGLFPRGLKNYQKGIIGKETGAKSGGKCVQKNNQGLSLKSCKYLMRCVCLGFMPCCKEALWRRGSAWGFNNIQIGSTYLKNYPYPWGVVV